MVNQRKAYLFAIIAVLLWSTAASAFKISLRFLDVITLLLFASFTSLIILFTTIIFTGRLKLLKKNSISDIKHSALLGFLNPYMYYIILLHAYSLLPAQEALSLNYLWPLMITLLSIPILKQKIKPWSIIAIIISLAGVIIIATRGNILALDFTNTAGVTLALTSTIIWSIFWIYNVKDCRDEIVKLFMNFIFGTIYIMITLLLTGNIEISFDVGIFGAVYVGMFEMGITFILWLNALKFSSTTAKVSNLIFLSPFLSLFVIRIAVGENIMLSTISGLILIISGILIQRQFG